jgi:hypothetical protein
MVAVKFRYEISDRNSAIAPRQSAAARTHGDVTTLCHSTLNKNLPPRRR